MRVLVTYGSKRGGTAGLAEMLGEALAAQGLQVDVRPAAETKGVEGYDAVIVGGALYLERWHRDARRFIKRNAEALQSLPVWLFSSGPLDDSAAQHELPPIAQVERLMNWIGARGHKTFGGRLLPDAKGFIASKMARDHSGDWRDPRLIRAWAAEIGEALRAGAAPWEARPRAEEQPPETPIV
ncbi:MAG: flavodoxin [Myxococcaceae bacterium]|nr:flavodoxin [Myxococcaceae bacterium]